MEWVIGRAMFPVIDTAATAAAHGAALVGIVCLYIFAAVIGLALIGIVLRSLVRIARASESIAESLAILANRPAGGQE